MHMNVIQSYIKHRYVKLVVGTVRHSRHAAYRLVFVIVCASFLFRGEGVHLVIRTSPLSLLIHNPPIPIHPNHEIEDFLNVL